MNHLGEHVYNNYWDNPELDPTESQTFPNMLAQTAGCASQQLL